MEIKKRRATLTIADKSGQWKEVYVEGARGSFDEADGDLQAWAESTGLGGGVSTAVQRLSS
jgi:hypothetical protein